MTRARVGPAEPGLKARGQLQRPCTHGCRGEDGRSVFFSFSFLPTCRFSSAFGSWHWCPSVVLPTDSGFSKNPAACSLGYHQPGTFEYSMVPEVGAGVPARRTGKPLTRKKRQKPKPPPAGTCGEPGTKHAFGPRVCSVLWFVAAAPQFCPWARSARSLTCAPTAPRSREAPRKPGSARNSARAPPNIANPVRVFRLSGLCARPGTRFATVKGVVSPP